MKVYIGQLGRFWSLSYPQWVSLCQKAVRTEHYDLHGYRVMKYRPRGLSPNDKGGFTKTAGNFLYFELMDWKRADFAKWLEENGHPIEEQK